MQNVITIRDMAKAARKLNSNGDKFSLLGIGPMSKTLIKATLELSKERDFPVMLIASRNQVDSDEFGHGYVCDWDQDRFIADVKEIADEIDFNGLCYFCRDHGGPWQRDEERAAKLPVNEAMEICIRSYKNDIKSGFDLLHIDPTKDPEFEMGTVPLDLVIDRTIEIIRQLETYRKENGLQKVGYEVGTEETSGGLTSVGAFSNFVDVLVSKMNELDLPAPEYVVGQTGTLTRLTENVGKFNRENAQLLSENALKHSVGIKEHNGDYLSDLILLEHPHLGITAMNVAPEFGVVETRAYLELAKVEERNIEADKCSNVKLVMSEYAVKSERWRKWVMADLREQSVEEILKNEKLTGEITDICGHYTYEIPEVKAEIKKMMKNLKSVNVHGEKYVIYQIKKAVDRYVFCFNLYGSSSKIINEVKKN